MKMEFGNCGFVVFVLDLEFVYGASDGYGDCFME
jgi:hypothetical protein